MGRVAELERLRERLRLLRLQYYAFEAHTDTNERFAIHQSLVAMIDFMNAMPNWRGLDFAFVKMMAALFDIENGRSVDWLSNPAHNRPPISIDAAVLRGRLAGLMELLIREGQGRRQAAEEVLKQIPAGHSVLEGVANPTWKTIARWRDNVIGSAAPSAERESFQAMLALAERIG